jgi:glycine dehydrogenase subunit 1
MSSYLPSTARELRELLETLGKTDPEELFAHIPPRLRLHGDLDLPGPLSEPELV